MKNTLIILCLLFVSAFAKAQQLQSYIDEAQSNNPEIQLLNCAIIEPKKK
ncbi:heavy metal RND efflux outer membrane protein [Nonlabens ulvanivorans]|uniref:Heavy metal RND efflux outer membrane protein n=1 Tax=Nonlabens ulvanivorans TaxID=906888 RepID=A0A081DBY7_NONUL|nr:heavy metal RND efflux outer membrane protein [Nonlabens ulvanivorans]